MMRNVGAILVAAVVLNAGAAGAADTLPPPAPAKGGSGQVSAQAIAPGPGEASRKLVTYQYTLNCDAVANLCYGTFLTTTAKQHFDFKSILCHVVGGADTVSEVYFRYNDGAFAHIIELAPTWKRKMGTDMVGDFATALLDTAPKGNRQIEAAVVYASKPRYTWCTLVGELATDL